MADISAEAVQAAADALRTRHCDVMWFSCEDMAKLALEAAMPMLTVKAGQSETPLVIIPLPVDASLYCAIGLAVATHTEQHGQRLTTAHLTQEETEWGPAVLIRLPERSETDG